MGRLTEKRAIISGAGSGIGRATALKFAEEGALIGLIDINVDAIEEVAGEIEAGGGQSLLLPTDVTDEKQVAESVGGFTDKWDGLDIVICNAAVFLNGQDAPVHELQLEVWNRTLDVNLTGAFLVAKYGVRALLAGGAGGSVIFTGSPTGMFGVSPTFDAYSASKAGIHGLMRVMAADYGSQGIRVNAVVPGFTDTPSTAFIMADEEAKQGLLDVIPLGRPGRAEEVAAVMAFLASDEVPYVTGAFYHTDGGITAV